MPKRADTRTQPGQGRVRDSGATVESSVDPSVPEAGTPTSIRNAAGGVHPYLSQQSSFQAMPRWMRRTPVISVLAKTWSRIMEKWRAGIIESLSQDPFQRDPKAVETAHLFMRKLVRYFDNEVRHFERLPASGPALVVGNHSGGMFEPDAWGLWARWSDHFAYDNETYGMASSSIFLFPRMSAWLLRMGGLPASWDLCEKALQRKAFVWVYPGGDLEPYRPWKDRHKVDLAGRTGFIRIALRQRVPIIPVVSHGAHSTFFVLSQGRRAAEFLNARRVRLKVFPLFLCLPWGVGIGYMPFLPLPAKILTEFCEPIEWPELDPEHADDEAVIQRCYDQVLEVMQRKLDELVAEMPSPLAARFAPTRRIYRWLRGRPAGPEDVRGR